MLIVVGSKNPTKVGAVQSILSQHPFFTGATFSYAEVPSGVNERHLVIKRLEMELEIEQRLFSKHSQDLHMVLELSLGF